VTAIRLLRRDSFCQKQSLRTETDKLYMRPILRFRYEQISLDKWARLWHGCYEFYQSNYPLDPHPQISFTVSHNRCYPDHRNRVRMVSSGFSASTHAFSVAAEGNISEIAGL
jgi:hypothetical protein